MSRKTHRETKWAPEWPTTTREAIAEAARRQFAELGYDRTTLRGIAGEAGVDVALDHALFYGSKDALFPRGHGPAARGRRGDGRSGGRTDGERQPPRGRSHRGDTGIPRSRSIVIGRIRSASGFADSRGRGSRPRDRDARRWQTRRSRDRRRTRDTRGGSSSARKIVGLALARYVVRVEPLASLPAADMIDYVAPVFQHYLVGPLKAG